MKSSDCCQPVAVDRRRSGASVRGFFQVAIVASRIWRWRAGSGGEVRHRRERRVEALLRVGGDLVHRLERRRRERRQGVALGRERRRPGHEARPRQRHDVVHGEDDGLDARLAQLDRLVVGEAGGGIDGALLERGRLAVVRELDDRRRRPASGPPTASRAWSMIHDEPYLPGMPIFLPLRSAAVLMPGVRPWRSRPTGTVP